MQRSLSSQIPIARLSLVAGPLFFGLSTFFWENGSLGTTGGALLNLSFVFWIPAFQSLFALLEYTLPVYRAIGSMIAYAGCLAGANFAFADYFTTVFGIPHSDYLEKLAAYPVSSSLLLFSSGPLFPLSLLILALVLLRKRLIPRSAGWILALGALLFPPSRILRMDWLAHVADGLILLPMCLIAAAYPACLTHALDITQRRNG